MERYPDGLRLSEVEPLLEYVGSMMGSWRLPAVQAAAGRLRELWTAEIAEKGCVAISKDTGVFLAVR